MKDGHVFCCFRNRLQSPTICHVRKKAHAEKKDQERGVDLLQELGVGGGGGNRNGTKN